MCTLDKLCALAVSIALVVLVLGTYLGPCMAQIRKLAALIGN